MNRTIRSCLILCTLVLLGELVTVHQCSKICEVQLLLGSLTAQSAQDEAVQDPRPQKTRNTLSEEFISHMAKVTTALDKDEDLEKAREILDRMLKRTQRWNDSEIAYIHIKYARVGLDIDDMDVVVDHLKKILEYREHIQYMVEEQTLWQLAQIYTTRLEDYDTGLDYVQQWMDLKLDWEESARAYAFIANIYTLKEDWLQSIHWMKQAIAKAEDEGQLIEEEWWKLILHGYSNLAEEAKAAKNLSEESKYLHEASKLSNLLANEYGLVLSRPSKNITAFSVTLLDSLAVVGDFIKEQQYEQAAKKLDELWQHAADYSPSEKAEIKYMAAGVAHHREQFDVVISSLESVLDYRENIVYAREEEVLLRLSKLYASQKSFEKAHERLKDWLTISDKPAAQDLAFAGKLYVQVRDFGRAKGLLERAIEQQREAGEEVDSQLTDLLKSVNHQLNIDN